MNVKSKLFILGLVSKIFAAKFSVISLNGDCQLNLGRNAIPMKKVDASIPLYTVEAPANAKDSYNYSCGGKAEAFQRVFIGGKTTHNEFFERAKTLTDMPEFGYPNAEPWNRSIGRTELFNPDYVPTIIIDGDKQFFVDYKTGNPMFNQITFILMDNYFTFNNIPVSAKNGDEDKFQLRVELPEDGIYHRNVLKFRPSSFDPVFFRQLMYGDILHAIGNPTHESVAARVYLSDGTPIGLYVLQEDVTTESFVRTAFFGQKAEGDLFGEQGPGSIAQYEQSVIYDCSTGADFTDKDGKFLGSFQNNIDDYKIELKAMTDKLWDLNVNDVESVNNFDKNDLNLDIILKALALEYLAGHWDSYWFLSTNFVVYHPSDETVVNPYGGYDKYRYYFVDQDFDQTWGLNMYPQLNPTNFPNTLYSEYFGKDWIALNGNPDETHTRIIVDKLINCDGAPSCVTKDLFESHIQSIVQHIFNPVAIGRKVDGYKERLEDEVAWDYSIPRLHISTKEDKYHFTMEDFNGNIESGNYPGSRFEWGIMDWTTHMANTICNHFGIEYDKVALTPEEAMKMNTEAIEPGKKYDAKAKSGAISIMKAFNSSMIAIIAIIMAMALYL